MAFESFEVERRREGSTRDEVALQQGGTVAFGINVHKALGEPEEIEFFYDRSARLVGFAAANPDSKNSFKVSRPKASPNQVTVRPKAFLSHFGLVVDTARRFEPRQRQGMWCIDLAEPTLVRGEGRLS